MVVRPYVPAVDVRNSYFARPLALVLENMVVNDTPLPLAAAVRRPVLNDVHAIAVFQTACWNEAYAGLVPQEYLDRIGVGDRERRWRDRLVSGDRRVALAEVEGRVVGVVSWGESGTGRGPTLELKSLYVAAAHRSSGTAAHLLVHAVGEHPAHLWVFRDDLRAQAFYRKHGFLRDGCVTIDPDTGLPEVRMSRG